MQLKGLHFVRKRQKSHFCATTAEWRRLAPVVLSLQRANFALQREDNEVAKKRFWGKAFFIGPESDLCLALSVTHCSCWDLKNVTLACEHANSKLGPQSSSPKESSNQTNCWSLVQILKIIFLLWKYLFGKDLGVECCQERRQDGWMNPSRDFDNWIWSRFWRWIRCYLKQLLWWKKPTPWAFATF